MFIQICCGICSLQHALSVAVVATTNQRRAWRMEIPSYTVCQWSQPCSKQRVRPDIGRSYNKTTGFQLQKVSIMSDTYNFSFLRRLALQFLLCTKNLLHQTTWTTRSFTGNIMVKFQSSLITLTNPGSCGKIAINSNEPLLSFFSN